MSYHRGMQDARQDPLGLSLGKELEVHETRF
jgi:hypothetical protein